MPIFNYSVQDKSGKELKGKAEALSQDTLADKLINSGYRVISITEERKFFSSENILDLFSSIKLNDKVMFTVQLSNMLGSGISLPAALNILIEQTENRKLKRVIKNVFEHVKGGRTFSDALRQHPDVFSTLFANMIQAGETSGNLEEILERLGKFLEREADLKQKLTTAMMYPVVLMTLGLAVVIGVVLFLLPSFTSIYQEANITLPWPTKFLLDLNYFLRNFWIQIILISLATIFGLRWFGKTPEGKLVFDNLKLKIPVWGVLIRKVTTARLCRTLGTLLGSGVSMLQSLETTRLTIDNIVLANVLEKVGQQVSKGENISTTFKESREFPPMPVQMIAVGEETGTLDTLLGKVADYYDLETDYTIKRITGLIEPVFLIIIGGLVGFIFASIILPIFNMAKTLSH